MKQTVCALSILVLMSVILLAGCTGISPGPVQPQGTGSPAVGTPVATTPKVMEVTTTGQRGAVIINDHIDLMSGYQSTYKEYAFEDFGYAYLYPNNHFKVTVTANKPVNLLVIDKNEELKFSSVVPQWNTLSKKNQWDYSPIVPAFAESNILQKDMDFTIRDKSKYYLVIDPRFASDQSGWQGPTHELVSVDVKVTLV